MIVTSPDIHRQAIAIDQEDLYPISVELFETMIREGKFGDDPKVQLINGQLVRVMPQESAHLAVLNALLFLLVRACGDRYGVLGQATAEFPGSLLEPDLMITRHLPLYYFNHGRPSPSEILMVIEVADSSYSRDRRIKAPIYAESGISEYWIVDVNQSQIEVFTDPKMDEKPVYGSSMTYRVGDWLPFSILGTEYACIEVKELFPAS
jgi:Uma2 family endonuclease